MFIEYFQYQKTTEITNDLKDINIESFISIISCSHKGHLLNRLRHFRWRLHKSFQFKSIVVFFSSRISLDLFSILIENLVNLTSQQWNDKGETKDDEKCDLTIKSIQITQWIYIFSYYLNDLNTMEIFSFIFLLLSGECKKRAATSL